jgi:hypothetical protein
LTDILVTSIPTGLVAAYTAFISFLSGLVDKPTVAHPHPNEFLGYRVAGLILLVLVSGGLVIAGYASKRDPTKKARFPGLEVSAAVVAALGWGLALPESPLLAGKEGNGRAALVALIAFAAIAVNLIIAKFLQKPAAN